MAQSYSLNELASHLDAKVVGDGSITISEVSTLQSAQQGQIAFLSNTKYRRFLAETNASAVLISEADAEHCTVAALVHENPYLAFALLAQLLDTTPRIATDIAPSAVVDTTAKLGKNVSIGANAVIDANVEIGDDVEIGAGCYIGKDAKIGDGCKFYPNVTIYHDVVIGKCVMIQSATVVGSDGFGYANDKGKWIRIPQTGSVIIGDNTEIGASTTIDRGALENTVIGNNVIIDNQCQVAHNCVIGDYSCMAGTAALSGSCTLGKYVILGGAAMVNGHIDICDGAQFTGNSMITKSVTEPGLYSSGIPATTNREWRKNTVRIRQLEDLYGRVKDMERQVKALQSADEDK